MALTKEEEEAKKVIKEQENAAVAANGVTPAVTDITTPETTTEPATQTAPATEQPVDATAPAPEKIIITPKAPVATTPSDPVRKALENAYQEQDKSFADYLQGIKDDYEREKAEGDKRINDAKRAARWTGATELASTIANLIGVGAGNAVSQQYKSVSQDWMRKADADAKEHRNRLSDLRQRQRETEMKIRQLKSQGGLALAQYDQAKRQQDIENSLAARKQALDEAYRSGQLSVQQYNAETSRLKEQAAAEQGMITAKANAARSYAQAQHYKNMDSDTLNFILNEYGDDPMMRLSIRPNDLLATIQTNIDTVEMSDDDKARVREIMEDEKKSAKDKYEELKPFIGTNTKLRNLVIKAAKKAEKIENGGGDGEGDEFPTF